MRMRVALVRRLFVAAAVVAVALPGAPAPVIAVTPPAAPDVVASGPNVFQKAPNGPIYFKPMTGKTPSTLLGTYGIAPTSEYHNPADVVVVGSYVYVLDAGNFRILKRKASNLAYVAKSASLVGHVMAPQRIASDGTYLYVTDVGLNAIVVFRVSTMAYVGKYGSLGAGTGHFRDPMGITVKSGRVYVADAFNNRVVKLTTWPIKWVKAFGTVGAGTGQFHLPEGVAVIGSYLYVADDQNGRVVRMSTAMTSSGWKVKTTYGSPATTFDNVDELATDGTSLYAHVQAWSSVVKLTSSLGFVKAVAPTGSKAFGVRMGMDANGSALYLTHAPLAGTPTGYNNQVTMNSRSTLAVARVSGTATPSPNEWLGPVSATTDGTHVYIGDVGRILVCSTNATTCTRSIPLPAGYQADGLTTDGTSLYAVDYGKNRTFRVVIATGAVNAEYGTAGTGNDNLSGPTGIVYLPSTNQIAVLDSGNNRVVLRSAATLAYASQAGSLGSGDLQLKTPDGIATDGVFLYIADTGNDRVVKWLATSLSNVSATTGGLGTGPGQFNTPLGIATDGDSVWVADYQNSRVVRLAAEDLSYQSQTKSTAAAPFADSIWGLACVGGKLLLLDLDLSRAYLEWGGGPLAVTATPTDGTAPWSVGFAWNPSAPAGWTPSIDTAFLLAPAATRYLGWTATAAGGSFDASINSLFNGSGTRTVTLIPDAAAPVVTAAPQAGLYSPLNNSTSSLKTAVVWSAKDTGAGIARTELARSVNGGAWSTVNKQSVSGGAATSMFSYVVTLKVGVKYQFRTRVTDTVGNVSAWKAGPAFTPAMVQEAGTGVKASSGWTLKSAATALGGHIRTATAASRTLTFTGTFRMVAVIGRGTPGGGTLKVYLDGVYQGLTNTNYGPTTDRMMVGLVPSTSLAKHTIKIVTVGDGPVSIDAFVVFK